MLLPNPSLALQASMDRRVAFSNDPAALMGVCPVLTVTQVEEVRLCRDST